MEVETHMIKKYWDFIKENVAPIIAIVTAVLTVVYAALRLCVYVYWQGYFTKLNIDVSIMNTNFDKSIFSVVFISIIVFVVLFFMAWVFELICDIKKKVSNSTLKGHKKFLEVVIAVGKGFILSFIILAMINAPLIILLAAATGIVTTVSNSSVLLVLLYIMEMLFIFTQMLMVKKEEKGEKKKGQDITIKIIEGLVFTLIILAILFYDGSQAIDKRKSLQLVEDEAYVITYCDGEHYVLHKVKYGEGKTIVYKNLQKIVSIEDVEYSIKSTDKVQVQD